MATLISKGTGDWTTAGTWAKACAGAGANIITLNAWLTVTASYVASPTFTIPNGEVIDGVLLYLRLFANAATGTLTVALFDGANELTTGTLTIADLSPNDSTLDEDFVLVKFGAAQTGDGGSDYTIKLKADATNKIQAYRASATAGDWWRVLRTTTASAVAPTSGDVLMVVGEGLSTTYTVTMNETATTAYGQVWIGGKGILSYGSTGGVNYVLRLAGILYLGCNGALRLGTTGTPIPRNSTAVLEFACASMGQYYLTNRGGELTMQGLSRSNGKNITWALLTADMNVGATAASIDTDTGWLSGDEVALFPTGWTTGGGEAITLNADAGADALAWTAGTSYTHKSTTPTAGEVALLTRNVKVRSTNSSYNTAVQINGYAPAVDCDWVEFQYCGATTVNLAAIDLVVSSHATVTVDFCSFRSPIFAVIFGRQVFYGSVSATFNVVWTTANSSDQTFTVSGEAATITFTDNVFGVAQGGNSYGIDIRAIGATTLDRNRVAGGAYGYLIQNYSDAGPLSFEDNIAHSLSKEGLYITTRITGTFTNLTIWGTNSTGVYLNSTLYDASWVNLTLIGNAVAGFHLASPATMINVQFSSCTTRGDAARSSPLGIQWTVGGAYCFDVSFDNCNFGAGTAHSTAVMNTTAGSSQTGVMLRGLRFRDCNFNANILIGANMPTALMRGSWIAFEKHSEAPIHRRLTSQGWIAIETTIFRTASPSEKVAPLASDATVRMQSTVRKVKIDSGTTKTINVWVYKDAGYAGSAPRLRVLANPALGWDADVSLDTMAGGAETWELLTGTTAAAGADGVAEVVVDCDGTADAIYVDDWSYS